MKTKTATLISIPVVAVLLGSGAGAAAALDHQPGSVATHHSTQQAYNTATPASTGGTISTPGAGVAHWTAAAHHLSVQHRSAVHTGHAASSRTPQQRHSRSHDRDGRCDHSESQHR